MGELNCLCWTCRNRRFPTNECSMSGVVWPLEDGEPCKDYEPNTGAIGVDLSRLPSPEQMRRIYEESLKKK